MASIKRNHTPNVKKNAACSECKHVASAPVGKLHRKCKGKPENPKAKGTWE